MGKVVHGFKSVEGGPGIPGGGMAAYMRRGRIASSSLPPSSPLDQIFRAFFRFRRRTSCIACRDIFEAQGFNSPFILIYHAMDVISKSWKKEGKAFCIFIPCRRHAFQQQAGMA